MLYEISHRLQLTHEDPKPGFSNLVAISEDAWPEFPHKHRSDQIHRNQSRTRRAHDLQHGNKVR